MWSQSGPHCLFKSNTHRIRWVGHCPRHDRWQQDEYFWGPKMFNFRVQSYGKYRFNTQYDRFVLNKEKTDKKWNGIKTVPQNLASCHFWSECVSLADTAISSLEIWGIITWNGPCCLIYEIIVFSDIIHNNITLHQTLQELLSTQRLKYNEIKWARSQVLRHITRLVTMGQ